MTIAARIDHACRTARRSPAEAETLLRALLEELDRTVFPAEAARAWLGIAESLVDRARFRDASHAAERALESFASCDDPGGEARATIVLGTAAGQLGRTQQARAWLVGAFRRAQACGLDDVASIAAARLARLYERMGDFPRAEALVVWSVRRARASGSPEALVHALTERGALAFETCDLAAGVWYFEWALELAREHHLLVPQAICLGNLAGLHLRRDDNRRGLAVCLQGLRLGEAVGNGMVQAFMLARIGYVNVKLGNGRGGIRALVRAHGMAETIGLPHLTIGVLSYIADAYRTLGDGDRELACHEAMLELERASCYTNSELIGMYHIGRLYTARGMPARAMAYHFGALRRARALGVSGTERAHLLGLACAYARVDDDRTAAHYFQAALTLPTEAGHHEFRVQALLGLAALAQRTGEAARSIVLLTEALPIAQTCGNRSLEAGTLHALADAHDAAGDPASAAEARAAADACVQAMPDAETRRWMLASLQCVERSMLTHAADRLGLESADLRMLNDVLDRERRPAPENVSAAAITESIVLQTTSAPAAAATTVRSSHPAYRVAAFGRLRVWVDGIEVSGPAWGRRRARELFKLLLVRYRRSVSIDEIIELLWDGRCSSGTENAVMNTVARLRRVLEPRRRPHAPSRTISSVNRSYMLDLGDDAEIDVRAFRVELAAAAREGEGARADRLRRAVALYHDDFLSEDRYVDWSASERELLKDAYIEALVNLAADELRQGRANEAVGAARRALECDRTSAAAYAVLLDALRRTGRAADAARAAEECRRAFRDEFGIDPPSTLVLLGRMSAGGRPSAGGLAADA